MRTSRILDKIEWVCVGPERVDEYVAEGLIIEEEGEIVAIVREWRSGRQVGERRLGTFEDLRSAREHLKDILYNLGRENDMGFGCFTAKPQQDSTRR